MKKLFALMALLITTQVSAEDKKADAAKAPAPAAAAADKDAVTFTMETTERNIYVIQLGKDGKAKVINHEAKRPIADVSHPKDWKGDQKKSEEAIKAAVNEFRKNKPTVATLGGFQDFMTGFNMVWGPQGVVSSVLTGLSPGITAVAKGVL